MTLSAAHIQSFIDCWKQDFGEVLTPEEAHAEAMRLLDFFVQFAEGLTRIQQRRGTEVPTPRAII